ncbi:MAG TPA: RNA polymerase sigma factor [Chloroflexota bacterium]|jgi:RNA polymerase sigma-70 factor (ECF subfamily)|nr:RNA polymerase sigma factor [Chloroflexota bacterium]
MEAIAIAGQWERAGISGDDALLAQKAREEPDAFAELYLRYHRRVYWYLRSRTDSDDDAADLTQHVFTQALAGLSRYTAGKAAFSTWLFTIARNAATDLHRRRRPHVSLDSFELLTPQSVEADVLLRNDCEQLQRLIAGLPSIKRELLALHFAGGLSVSEAAQVMGKSVGATRKQLSRTLDLLEERFDD